MRITPEMITALDRIRRWALVVKAETNALEIDKDTALAIDVLDNADFFVPIDDAREDDDHSRHLDAAEWGDTTRADMARHQQG